MAIPVENMIDAKEPSSSRDRGPELPLLQSKDSSSSISQRAVGSNKLLGMQVRRQLAKADIEPIKGGDTKTCHVYTKKSHLQWPLCEFSGRFVTQIRKLHLRFSL